MSGSKEAPDFLAQSRHLSWISSSLQQFSCAVLPQTIRFVSSTNPKPISVSSVWLTASKSPELKRRKRTGDREEPCGMPVCTQISGPLAPSKSSRVFLSVRNPEMIFLSQNGRPLLIISLRSLSCETLSKAALISRLRTETMSFGSAFQMECVASVRSVRADVTDLCFLAPNWVCGRRLCSSRTLVNLSAMRHSKTFIIEFSSAIGL